MERTGATDGLVPRPVRHCAPSLPEGARGARPRADGGAHFECCASPQQLAASAMQKSLELGAASADPADAAKSEALRRHAEELSRAPASVKRTHDVALWSAWLGRYAERLLKEEAAKDEAVWRRRMRSTNPRVVLRNWIAQEAIDAASSGDIDVVRKVLDAVTRPYDEAKDEDGERYALPLATVEGRCVS